MKIYERYLVTERENDKPMDMPDAITQLKKFVKDFINKS